jgi:hypothetical protein
MVTALSTRPTSPDPVTTESIPARPSARRFVWSCTGGIVVSLVVFAWVVTAQSWNFFRSLPFSNFYDVQARSLLAGHFYMSARVLWIEGYRVDHHTYMYYGPVPALLRMPVLLFTHRFDGRLTEVSLMAAFVVALVAVSRLVWKARLLIRGTSAVGWGEAVLSGAWVAAIGLGSVLLFLGANIQVYNEAELWGAALTLCALDAIVGFVIAPSGARVGLCCLFATLAVMTRGSVGASAVAALALMALGHGVLWTLRRVEARRGGHAKGAGVGSSGWIESHGGWLGLSAGARTRSVALGAAAALPVVVYAVVNEIKFHTLFSIPFRAQAFEHHNPKRLAALAANHGSLFGPEYVPTALLAYLRPDAIRFTRLFPFVAFPGHATVIGHAVYDTLDFYTSVTTSMPLLLVAALAGLVVLVAGSRLRFSQDTSTGESVGLTLGARAFTVPVLGAVVGTVGVLTIAYIAIRYLADIVPLVVVLACVGFVAVSAWAHGRSRLVRAVLIVAAGLLALFGVWVNLGLSLVFQHELEPNVSPTVRGQLVGAQSHIDSALFGSDPPPVTFTSSLPKDAPVGSLAVIGNCDGLYQFDGTQWYGVEIGPAGGAIGLDMSFTGGRVWSRQPVLQVGLATSGEVLAVQHLAGGSLRFSYRSLLPGQGWFNGRSFSAVPGRRYHVIASFDARVQQVTAIVDGTTEMALVTAADGFFTYPVAAPGPVALGAAPKLNDLATSYSGYLRRTGVTTPICTSFLDRRR